MRNRNLYTPSDFFAEARGEAEVSNLLNTDMYKVLMMDFILANEKYKNLNVKWEMKIRTPGIRTAEVIPKEALEKQLEMTKNIKGISEADASYLRGMTTSQGEQLFKEETISYLKDMTLPDYEIGIDENNNYTLSFEGPWPSSMMREIYGLKIINSSYMYHYIKKAELSDSEFNQVINESINRLYKDITTFKNNPDLTFLEFGTRRSLSTDYHRLIFDILSAELPEQCLGTSNIMLSHETGYRTPKGTNAHELRMIPTALHDDPTKIIDQMYDIDRERGKHFPELSLLLPDTYGSSFYFEHCPEDIATSHKGLRVDSKPPKEALPEYKAFLEKHNRDPKKQLALPSDGENATSASSSFQEFKDDFGTLSYGIGTSLSNNTKDTRPREELPYGPFGSFSVVIKPMRVQRPNGERTSCVKLSDNPEKAMGDPKRVEYFKEIFGVLGHKKQEVLV